MTGVLDKEDNPPAEHGRVPSRPSTTGTRGGEDGWWTCLGPERGVVVGCLKRKHPGTTLVACSHLGSGGDGKDASMPNGSPFDRAQEEKRHAAGGVLPFHKRRKG